MITLDKYLQAPLKLSYSQAEYDRMLDAWEGKHHFERLDRITSSEEELDRLVDVLREMKEDSFDLVLDAGLPEFELVVRDTIPSMSVTVIRYKKSALAGKTIIHGDENGKRLVYTAMIDMYISFQQFDCVDVISTIYVAKAVGLNNQTKYIGTANVTHWCNEMSPVAEWLKTHPENFATEMYRDMRLIYIAIQRALKYKPEIFYTSSLKKIEQIASGKRKKKTQRNHARVVKMMRINKEEVKRYAAPVKHMSCPCWGVIGHMRTYKSGKQVWIAPYRKGKLRNETSAYEPKEYVMEG